MGVSWLHDIVPSKVKSNLNCRCQLMCDDWGILNAKLKFCQCPLRRHRNGCYMPECLRVVLTRLSHGDVYSESALGELHILVQTLQFWKNKQRRMFHMWYWVCFENLAKLVIPNSLQLRNMSIMASRISSDSTVCSTVCSSSHTTNLDNWPVWGDSPQKGSAMQKIVFLPWRRHIPWWCHQMETFPRNWPFVRGIHRSPVNSPHKGQWRRALMFSLISVWINDWVNSREAGDLRCYRPHYDVTVMIKFPSTCSYFRMRDEACETLALRKSVVSHINQKLKIGITTPDVFAMCYFLAIGDVNMMELKVKNICKRICMSMYKRHIIWVLLSN